MAKFVELSPIPTTSSLSDMNPSTIELGTQEPNELVKPKFLVFIDDVIWEGIGYCTLEFSGFGSNSTFTLDGSYSVLGNCAVGAEIDPNSRLAQLIQAITRFRHIVKIYIGYSDSDAPSPEELTKAFVGVLDDIQVDVHENAVQFTGRDLSALFQESYTHAQFRNKTSTGVVKELVNDIIVDPGFGLEGQIIESGTPVGVAFDYEHIDFESVGSEGYNNWEIILKLADNDGYKAFFWGENFYYVPYEYYLGLMRFQLGLNVDSLKMRKNFSVANSRVRVEIASTEVKGKDNVIAVIGPAASSGTKGDRAEVREVVPGLSAEDAGLLAETLALYYAQREYIVTLTTVGAPQQSILKQFALVGTGTSFNRVYRIIHLSWQFGVDIGWHSEITGIQLPDNVFVQGHRVRMRNRLSTRGK